MDNAGQDKSREAVGEVCRGPTARELAMAGRFVCETFSGNSSDDVQALAFLLAGVRGEAYAKGYEAGFEAAEYAERMERAEPRHAG